MLVMVVFFIAFRRIHLSTPLIRLFLLVLILLLMPTLNFLPVWFALSLLRFRLPSRLPMMFILWMVNNLFNNLIQRNQSAAFSSGKVRPNHETNINIIARRTGKDVNSHTVLDGIITTIMATIQRINIIGSREGSRNRRRL